MDQFARNKVTPDQSSAQPVPQQQRAIEKLLLDVLPEVSHCLDQLPEKKEALHRNAHEVSIPTPEIMVEELDKIIIGNARAKKDLALHVYSHYLPLSSTMSLSEVRDKLGIYYKFSRKRSEQVDGLIAGLTSIVREHRLSASEKSEIFQEVDLAIRAGRESRLLLDKPLNQPPKENLNQGAVRKIKVKRFLKTLMDLQKKPPEQSVLRHRSNHTLIVGPTGSGKTQMVERLAGVIGVPFVSLDACQFTGSGYEGLDLLDIGRYALQAANGDAELAGKAIIYIDEFDKRTTNARYNGGSTHSYAVDLQNELLRMLERYSNPETGFQSSDMLFVFSGSFEGIEKIIAQRTGQSSIGFHTAPLLRNETEIVNALQGEDLVKYGMHRELVGRLNITVTEPMTAGKLRDILLMPGNSYLQEFKRELDHNGIKLRLTSGAATAIAEITLQQKIGARALGNVLQKVLQDFLFQAPSLSSAGSLRTTTLTLNKATVLELWQKAL